MKRFRLLGFALLVWACHARVATAQIDSLPASPPDSSFDRFLKGLSDSTDRYFGTITAPLDTAGLDSALATGLVRQWRGVRSPIRRSVAPVYAFQRVDGSLWGASAAVGHRAGRWRIGGDLAYAAGSDRLLGGGDVRIGRWRGEDYAWSLRVRAGRRTNYMNRDHAEGGMSTLRALIWGSDRQHYLRRDGLRVAFAGRGRVWRAGIEYRDRLESPLAVTTRWNLARDPLEITTNLPAAFGRTRELAFETAMRWPGFPFQAQITHELSDGTLGSDFDYRRTRVAVGGEWALGRHLSLLPQVAYGRLGGDAVPQASFYLGGPHTLRSMGSMTLGGTGMAMARLEVIGADDLLSLLHLPHPAMFPLQGGAFVASGAAWGRDPFGGPGSSDVTWPETSAWLSEAGFSLLYRPGIPDEQGYFRLNYAHSLGSAQRSHWSVSYSRALDLLRPF